MTTKTDISNITFSSTVFPSAEDKKVWNSLSEDDKEALLVKWELDGFNSGKADEITVDQGRDRIAANALPHELQS